MNNATKKVLSFALAGTVVAGVPVAAHADTNTNEKVIEEVANTTSYVVKEGDTLGKIAEKFYGNAAYYEQLAAYNHIDTYSLIFPGQIITIPQTLTVQNEVVYDYQNNEVVVNAYEEDKTYTVKEGDTLYCIVRVQYGLTNQEAVDKLATYNGLSDPNRISRGQVLLIPCLEKLLQVVQNDYTDEYNRMGWILNHPDGCRPHKKCNPCGEVQYFWVPVYTAIPYQPCLPPPCEPPVKPECDHPCLKLVP